MRSIRKPWSLGVVAVVSAVALAATGGPGAQAQNADAVMLAAGDIADCGYTAVHATAALLDAHPGTVATLGDNTYPDGTTAEFTNCYDPTWGRAKARTRPTPGNHDYHTPGASGYYGYFGAAAGDPAKGYYSYDLGSWHVVALNSNCSQVGGCGPGSPQERWLRQDLAASAADCTVAYWHHPRFSSGAGHGSSSSMRWFWQALYDNGADLVLSAHQHSYERFAPQTPDGAADPTHGIRQLVVGTGGAALVGFATPIANSKVREATTHGILKLRLRSGGYDWRFLPVAGKSFTDSGSGTCHGAPAPGELLPNGSFESGLTGWGGWQAALTATAGTVGAQAAHVTPTVAGGGFAIFTHPRPVGPSPAGVSYRARGWVRGVPGRQICLVLREWRAGAAVNWRERCIVAGGTWQQFPELNAVAEGADALELFVWQAYSEAGDSFDVDGLSLTTFEPDGELLPNGSFESGLSGWGAWQGTLTLTAGTVGAQAARLTPTVIGGGFAIFVHPRPVRPSPAGVSYRARGWVRGVGGRQICLVLREWIGAAEHPWNSSCITVTRVWQPFPELTATAQGGDSLELFVWQATSQAGDRFDVDGLSLTRP